MHTPYCVEGQTTTINLPAFQVRAMELTAQTAVTVSMDVPGGSSIVVVACGWSKGAGASGFPANVLALFTYADGTTQEVPIQGDVPLLVTIPTRRRLQSVTFTADRGAQLSTWIAADESQAAPSSADHE